MRADIPTDECITREQLERIHEEFVRNGIEPGFNALAEREASLAAYVLASSVAISNTVKIAGAPESLVQLIEHEVTGRLMVCIEAVRQAHYEL